MTGMYGMIREYESIPGFDGLLLDYETPEARRALRHRRSKRQVGGNKLKRVRMIQKRNRFLWPDVFTSRGRNKAE